MKYLYLSAFLFLFSGFLLATTFVPLTLDKQVESASMGAEVILESQHSFQNDFGHIVTEYSFRVVQGYNLNNELLNNKKIIFQLPGGSYNGLATVVDGSPSFEIGKKIFILLKEVKNKIYLSNFTLGKFNIEKYKGEEFFINEVFPKTPNVGRIKKSSMIKLMQDKWNFSIVENKKESVPVVEVKEHQDKNPPNKITKEDPKREVASIDDIESAKEGQESLKYLIICLAVLGIFVSFLLLRLDKNEK